MVQKAIQTGSEKRMILNNMKDMKTKFIAFLCALAVVAAVMLIVDFKTSLEVKPTLVYVANQDIPPHTLITEDMLSVVEVPERAISPTMITNKKDIVGHYVQINYGIPINGFFYQEKVVSQESLMDAIRMKLKPGQVLWTGTVDIEESAAGNVVPGSVVDIWLQTSNPETKAPVVGRLYRNVYVLSTKNKKGEDIVNKSVTSPPTDANGKKATVTKEYVPSIVQLALTDDQYELLEVARTGIFNTSKVSLVPQAGDLVNNVSDIPQTTEVDKFDIKPYILGQIKGTNNQVVGGTNN